MSKNVYIGCGLVVIGITLMVTGAFLDARDQASDNSVEPLQTYQVKVEMTMSQTVVIDADSEEQATEMVRTKLNAIKDGTETSFEQQVKMSACPFEDRVQE